MKRFVVYNSDGKILRSGSCQNATFYLQAKEGEFILEGEANDAKQKIVNGEVVDKTPEEIALVDPLQEVTEVIAPEKHVAFITNGQWQNVLNRLKKLEIRSTI